jgi:BirA family biotin operon repressor/biotin-[acetyl-CoA-carboxylase] ligase
MKFDVGQSTRTALEKVGVSVHYKLNCESTSTWAKQEVQSLEAPCAFLTSHQTQGRGRGTNTWTDSTAGDNLTLTLCFPLQENPGPVTSARVGLVLIESLQKIFGVGFALKAPNDIYVGSKKLAGILVENIQQNSQNTLCVGIGLNVWSAPDFARSLKECLPDETPLRTEKWQTFVTTLILGLQSMTLGPLRTSPQLLLDDERSQLLTHLNAFAGKSEPYFDITPEGSLKSAHKTTRWSEL